MKKITALWEAFKVAFDSLVRTYSPQVIALLVGLLVGARVEVTPEVQGFISLLVAFVFSVVWYLLNRLWEVITGKVSKLLTFGLVATKPVTYSALTKSELEADYQAAAARKALAQDK